MKQSHGLQQEFSFHLLPAPVKQVREQFPQAFISAKAYFRSKFLANQEDNSSQRGYDSRPKFSSGFPHCMELDAYIAAFFSLI
jgi:hypothetical protein